MSRSWRLAALLLPAFGLAGLWAKSDHTYRQGTEWEVPIAGYDPRDYLRGHYVDFTYDWSALAGAAEPTGFLCLAGTAPRLTRAEWRADAAALADCAHPVMADPYSVYGRASLDRGRLYIGQDRAAALERQLRDRDLRALVTIRQREDGSFTPVTIRLRPLTPAERAARDAQDGRDAERPEPAVVEGDATGSSPPPPPAAPSDPAG